MGAILQSEEISRTTTEMAEELLTILDREGVAACQLRHSEVQEE